jgi:putative spermidine/putrescine transport system substrate-binding protein
MTRIGLTAIAAALAGGASAQTLTINSFGGAYEEAHRECVIAPFEEETGAEVQIVTAYSADAFAQLRAQAAAPQFDVIHFSGGQEIVGAEEGLLSPIDPASLENADALYDFAKRDMEGGEGPAYSIAAIGLLHNTETTEAPSAWADLTEEGRAERMVLTDISNGYGMLGFLMLNEALGGSLEDIQPGLDAVAELLERGAIVVTTSPEIQQEFAQNDAGIAPYASDYAFTLREAGLPVAFVQGEEGTPASFITVNLVANRPNQELALRFIDRTISAEAQACFARALRYSPTNREAEIPGDIAADMVVGEEAVSGLVRFDPTVIEANRADWVDRWTRTIAR